MNSELYKIMPLSDENLNKAVALVKKIFPYKKDQRDAKWSFTESLSNQNSGKKYWLAVNTEGKIVGITGLYKDTKDNKVVWLGWFGVHFRYRRQGIGSQLLEFSISEAIKGGFSKLNLYTSSDKNEIAAHELYRKFGFIQSAINARRDVIYFEKRLEEENMSFTEIIEVINTSKHQKLIDQSIRSMKDEFDRFIQEMEEVPWLYNERALLGLYISGLVRNRNTVVLQEFVCDKGKSGEKRGRSDLLFVHNKERYLIEAKLCYSSAKTKTTFKGAAKWAKEVLKQANSYRESPDFKNYVKAANIFSLCFEGIWCTQNNIDNFLNEDLRDWTDESEIKKSELDFYYLIHADKNEIKRKGKSIKWPIKGDKYFFYPAVAVYGVFNK